MIRLRAQAQRRRFKALAIGVALLLGLLIAWEHSGAAEHDTAGDMGFAGAICLAVMEAGLGFAFAVAVRRRPQMRAGGAAPDLATARASVPGAARRPPPRASPSLLQVFLR